MVVLLAMSSSGCAEWFGEPCTSAAQCGSAIAICDPALGCTTACPRGVGQRCGSADNPQGVCAVRDAGPLCLRGCPSPGCNAGFTCVAVGDAGLSGCLPSDGG